MHRKLTLIFAFASIIANGCQRNRDTIRITGGGSTFVDPIMQKWSAEYKRIKNIEIDYIAKGSGYGITNLISRNIDFACSDVPMNAKELEAAQANGGEVIHIPVAIGAVAIIYNVDVDVMLTGKIIADIYLRKITRWNDAEIQKINSKVNLPDLPISPTARAESSGTSYIFTEYLSKCDTNFREHIGVTKSPKFPRGVEGKNGSDGITDFVKVTKGAIGYVELAYAHKGSVRIASIVNRTGNSIKPNSKSVSTAVTEASRLPQENEPYNLHQLTYSLTDAWGNDSYPIVGASYGIIFKRIPKNREAIIDFIRWVTSEGQKYAAELDYAILPEEISVKAHKLLETIIIE
ncbi:MAG: phosphate ABC transporter substrate-binding protein PstS [Candidatus Bilamarchaeaceae archaeon]